MIQKRTWHTRFLRNLIYAILTTFLEELKLNNKMVKIHLSIFLISFISYKSINIFFDTIHILFMPIDAYTEIILFIF